MKTKNLLLAILLMLLMIGCAGEKKEAAKEGMEKESAEMKQPAEAMVVKLVIAGNDQMKYDKAELRVKAGSKVELTLNHTGKLGKDVMGHNVVILKSGVDPNQFAVKAIAAKATDFIPAGDEIIANTTLIGGGETTTITFDAPEKGTYDFICTFPGHFALMKGKFIVE